MKSLFKTTILFYFKCFRENFLRTLERVSGAKIALLNQQLATEKYRSSLFERKAEGLKKRFQDSFFQEPDEELLDKMIMLNRRLEAEENYSFELEKKVKEL